LLDKVPGAIHMFDDKIVELAIMSGSYFLALLVAVPILAFLLARRRLPAHLYSIVGATFGAIVSPLALGLYSLYFLSPWGVIPGFLGLALTLVHGVPGFEIAVHTGLVAPAVVTDLKSSLIIELINGLVWALIYAFIGFAIDRILSRRRSTP